MKYIKQYEDINNIELDDYVVCIDTFTKNIELSEFIQTNIGQVVKIVYDVNYYVQYDNIPEQLKSNFDDLSLKNTRLMNKHEIIESSKNKEDLVHLITANKYNL